LKMQGQTALRMNKMHRILAQVPGCPVITGVVMIDDLFLDDILHRFTVIS